MKKKLFKLSKYVTPSSVSNFCDENGRMLNKEVVKVLNEQQELIEELQVSDEMGWKRAEHFEKKCPKELHNKKMYIKRLEYKVQKFKEENKKLKERAIVLEKLISDVETSEGMSIENLIDTEMIDDE